MGQRAPAFVVLSFLAWHLAEVLAVYLLVTGKTELQEKQAEATRTVTMRKGIEQRLDAKTFTAYVEWDPETKLYVGIVPGIVGAHTQGATLDELQKTLKEALGLCLEELGGSLEDLPHFVGLQQVEIEMPQQFVEWLEKK
jgi:predicted RNase H-like HicB family nuclease